MKKLHRTLCTTHSRLHLCTIITHHGTGTYHGANMERAHVPRARITYCHGKLQGMYLACMESLTVHERLLLATAIDFETKSYKNKT